MNFATQQNHWHFGFLKSRFNLLGIIDGVVGKSMLSIVDQLTVSATGFLSGVIVARYCTLPELGAYHLAISILLILQGIQGELVTAPFTIYQCRLRNEHLDTYTGSVMVHQTACILGAFLLLCTLYFTKLGEHMPSAFRTVLPILLLTALLALIREFSRQYSFARLQFNAVTVADLSVLMIQLVGLYLVARIFGLTVPHTFGIIGLASVVACFTWWSIARPHFRIQWNRIIPDWRKNWIFSRWALTSHIVCSSTYLMPWIVAWLRSEAEAGKLAACVSLIGLSNMFTTAITNVLTPKMAAVYATEGLRGLRRVCEKVMLLFFLVLGCFSLLVFLAGNWLGTIVYGSAFSDVGLLCGIEALGMLLTSFAIVAGKALLAIDRPRANLPADVTTAFVTIGMALFLIPKAGILGAAVARLIGFSSNALVRWVIVYKSWRELARENN